MRDVAERAGVSFKTVSRVINDEAGVSADLLGRVEHAIDALGYRPDDRARRLRRGGSNRVIGFALVDVANPFFSSILRGIEEVARGEGYLVLAGSTDGDAEREHRLIEAFLDRRVDGLVVVSSDPSGGPIFGEIARGTPVVFLDLEPEPAEFDLVRSDHLGGAVRATEHLLRHGHTEIAFLGDDAHVFSAGCRLAGYREAMTSAGLPLREDRVHCGHYSVEQWHDVVLELVQRDDAPTALFTAQNFITIGGVQALHELGLERKIALVGFDEVDLACAVEPGITVVPQHPLDLGRRAAEQLFSRLGGATGPPLRDVIASDLIPRGSGEISPRLGPRDHL